MKATVTMLPDALVDGPVAKPALRRLPRSGWRVVAAKEFGDGILSVRFIIVFALLGLPAVGAVYATASYVSANAQAATGAAGLFVLLFSHQDPSSRVPSLVTMIGLIGPLLGIAFGFDAINGERAERTLPRLVAQPIHRDAVIIGKFAAGLAVIGVVLLSTTLIVSGVAFLVLAVTPSPDDILRLVAWFIVSIAYIGFWLAFAMLCSAALRGAATSVLTAIGLWIVATIFWSALLVGLIANFFSPVPANPTLNQQIANAELQLNLARLSPGRLYTEASAYILDPSVQTLDIAPLIAQQNNARAYPSILPLDQSLTLAWPQLTALLAFTVVCFGLGYISFMRQEVRA